VAKVSKNESHDAVAPENSTVTPVTSPALTLREAAAYLRCSVKSVRKLCATGALSYQRIATGRLGTLVRRDEVERFLERRWHRALEPQTRPRISKKLVKVAKDGRNQLNPKG
jgi:excisionase family DNA binding protein